MDTVTRERRSQIMGRVRLKDAGPERAIRHLVRGTGYRLQLNGLPGTPELAFRGRSKVIFDHGCFWHGRKCRRLPKSRPGFWIPKLEGNHRRDARCGRAPRRTGWGVLAVWECQLGRPERLRARVRRFLDA